jgi:hypothetical protein
MELPDNLASQAIAGIERKFLKCCAILTNPNSTLEGTTRQYVTNYYQRRKHK